MGLIWSPQDSARHAAEYLGVLSDEPSKLVPMGCRTFDSLTGGLGPGTLSTLSAATGVGKTRSMLAFADRQSLRGVDVGVLSLEDPPDLFGLKFISAETGIDGMRIRRKDVTAAEKQVIAGAISRLEARRLKLAYPVGGRLESVLEAATELLDGGCRVLWVDYLQKLRGAAGSRVDEIGANMARLQELAYKYSVPVILVSQLRRRYEFDKEGNYIIPTIQDLKGNGDLENESRVIIMLYPDPGGGKDIIGMVAKSAYGGTGYAFRMTDKSGVLVEQ